MRQHEQTLETMDNLDKRFDSGKNDNKDEGEKLIYRFANLQGIGAREYQVDSFAFSDIFDPEMIKTKGVLAVIADGMGGLQHGKTASQTAVSVIRQSFSNIDTSASIVDQLNAMVSQAGAKVEAVINGKGGSTVIIALIFQDKLYFSSLGDSYLYLKRGEWFIRVNRPHNIAAKALADLVERGQTDPKKALIDNDPVALTEFLGKEPVEKIECFVRPLQMHSGDVLLLCTDGVGRTLNEREIRNSLSCDTPARMCSALEDRVIAKRQRNQDNYTALVIQCTDP